MACACPSSYCYSFSIRFPSLYSSLSLYPFPSSCISIFKTPLAK